MKLNVLISQITLLDRQIKRLVNDFQNEGDCMKCLYHVRSAHRRKQRQ